MTPEGTYSAEIVCGTLSDDGGKPHVVIQLRVTHVAVDGEWQPLNQPFDRRLYWYLHGNAEDHTMRKLAMLGFQGKFESMEFTEQSAAVRCSHETYKGQDRERWDLDNYGGGEVTPADERTVLDFNARWKNRQKASKPKGKPVAPVTAPPDDDPPDDDPPF